MPVLKLEQAHATLKRNVDRKLVVKDVINENNVQLLSDGLVGNTVLSMLSLSDCQLTDNVIIKLVEALKSCSTLRVLKLSWNRIGDLGAEALAQLVQNGQVQWTMLYLGGNTISPNGLKAFAAAICSPKSTLTTLDLGHNEIAEVGAVAALASALSISRLEELYLSNTWLADDSIRELAQGVAGCPTLQALSLSDNRAITDIGARYLLQAVKTHRALTDLFLHGTKVTLKTKTAIRARLELLQTPQAKLLTILCSVYVVNRLGKKATVRALPKDLLRRLKQMLYS